MGKTLNKLNYLKETKSQIKTALNQFGAGITNDTFRSYVSKISSIYDNWTKVTDEDSQINLTPTRKGKMALKLNSTELTQDGTPSPSSPVDINVIKGENNIVVQNKNLLNFTFTNPIEKNGITFTKNNNGSLTLNGTATTTFTQIFNITSKTLKGTYTIKHNVLGGTTSENSYMSIQKSPSGNISDRVYGGTGSNTYNITEDTTIITASLYINSGTTFTDYNVGSQLEPGSTATEYVEHQEQNYPISLASKNLFAGGNPFSFNVLLDYPLKLEAGTYHIKCGDMTQSPSETPMEYPVIIINNQPISIPKNANKTFTINSPIEKVNLYSNGWSYANSINVTATISDLIISKEDVNYEPYYNIEYCKIGNYADQIFKNTADSPYYDNTLIENEWYLKKNVNKVVLDGSENWQQFQTNVYVPSIFPAGISDSLVINGYCDKCLTNTNTNISYNGNAKTGLLIYNLVSFWGLEDTTPATWKTYLANNNLTLYYPLATPTYTQLSQENYPTLRNQLEEINTTPTSYSGTTNITQTNDGLLFSINASALMKGDE